MEYPSFEQFAEVVRSNVGLKRNRHIRPETELQRDLGMNDVEGLSLLKSLEARYGITFSPESFDRKTHEPLFHAKVDSDEYPAIQTVFGASKTEVRPLTVGNLCRAVLKELGRQAGAPTGLK